MVNRGTLHRRFSWRWLPGKQAPRRELAFCLTDEQRNLAWWEERAYTFPWRADALTATSTGSGTCGSNSQAKGTDRDWQERTQKKRKEHELPGEDRASPESKGSLSSVRTGRTLHSIEDHLLQNEAGKIIKWNAAHEKSERTAHVMSRPREWTWGWEGGMSQSTRLPKSYLPQPHQEAWVQMEDPNKSVTANQGGVS